MLSLTSDDMPNFTYASPEEMRGAQEKALNLWVGASLPLWAPFWLASAFGVGVWALGQGFKRAQGAIGAGFEPPVGAAVQNSATDVAGTVQNMVNDGVIAPMQAAGQTIQDMTTAVTPSPQTVVEPIKTTDDAVKTAGDEAKVVGDDVTAKATELGHAATTTVDKATKRAVEASEAQADAAVDVIADTGSLLTGGSALLPPASSKAATAVAADTAIAPADSDRPALRKPTSTKKS